MRLCFKHGAKIKQCNMNDAQIMKGGVCKKVNAKAKGVFCNCKPTSNARGWDVDVAYLSPIMVSFPVIEYIICCNCFLACCVSAASIWVGLSSLLVLSSIVLVAPSLEKS